MAPEDEGRLIVVLASIRWGYLWQRHQSLADAAAASDPVLFVESQPRRLRQLVSYPLRALRRQRTPLPAVAPRAGIRLVRPSVWALLTPGPWARLMQSRIRRAASGRPVYVILYVPTAAYVRLATRLADDGGVISYDAVVDWANAPASWYPPVRARSRERTFPSDWRVVSDSPSLANELALLLARPVAVVPPAADRPFASHPWPAMVDRRACLGWFGAIRRETDVGLLCAASRSGLRVHAVGTIEDAELGQRLRDAGVATHPPVAISDLPKTIEHWRVALLAYVGPRAGSITPAKLYNALTGFRVAVRGIAVPQEIEGRVVFLPADNTAAVALLSRLVSDDGRAEPPVAVDSDWRQRLAEILGASL